MHCLITPVSSIPSLFSVLLDKCSPNIRSPKNDCDTNKHEKKYKMLTTSVSRVSIRVRENLWERSKNCLLRVFIFLTIFESQVLTTVIFIQREQYQSKGWTHCHLSEWKVCPNFCLMPNHSLPPASVVMFVDNECVDWRQQCSVNVFDETKATCYSLSQSVIYVASTGFKSAYSSSAGERHQLICWVCMVLRNTHTHTHTHLL